MGRDLDKKRASDQAYRERNRVAIRARVRAAYAANAERRAQANERSRAWSVANPGKRRAWRDANPDSCRESYEAYRATHHDAIDARSHADRDARQAETKRQAGRSGEPWTAPELELAARPGLTAEQVALITGRTLMAVYRMRSRRKLRAR